MKTFVIRLIIVTIFVGVTFGLIFGQVGTCPNGYSNPVNSKNCYKVVENFAERVTFQTAMVQKGTVLDSLLMQYTSGRFVYNYGNNILSFGTQQVNIGNTSQYTIGAGVNNIDFHQQGKDTIITTFIQDGTHHDTAHIDGQHNIAEWLITPPLNANSVTGFWKTTGNTGTNPAGNFIGTTDAKDFIIKTNNVLRSRINADGSKIDSFTTSDGHQITAQFTNNGFGFGGKAFGVAYDGFGAGIAVGNFTTIGKGDSLAYIYGKKIELASQSISNIATIAAISSIAGTSISNTAGTAISNTANTSITNRSTTGAINNISGASINDTAFSSINVFAGESINTFTSQSINNRAIEAITNVAELTFDSSRNGIYAGYNNRIVPGITYSSNAIVASTNCHMDSGSNNFIVGSHECAVYGVGSNPTNNPAHNFIAGGFGNYAYTYHQIMLGCQAVTDSTPYFATGWDSRDLLYSLGNSPYTNTISPAYQQSCVLVNKKGQSLFGKALHLSDMPDTSDATVIIIGSVKIKDGTQGAGKVLTSDASGNATWDYPFTTMSTSKSGDGVTGVVTIAHLLSYTPTFVSAVPTSDDARGLFKTTQDATNVYLTYITPPVLGTNNLTYKLLLTK